MNQHGRLMSGVHATLRYAMAPWKEGDFMGPRRRVMTGGLPQAWLLLVEQKKNVQMTRTHFMHNWSCTFALCKAR
eukprot:1144408-Pelagomonas_calceolata.AAC.2